jgi:adenylosuccinate synthase
MVRHMKTSKIVLGAGYGDESKGLVVDNLCNDPKTLVIRFSGGFQCGHTVIRDGIKHVFSNFGSGTMRGCPTFFTEDTAININSIRREKLVLNQKGFDPVLYVHPLAKVGTPYDKIANRIFEEKNQHGSCGMGFGQCMKRSLQTPYQLFAQDLFAPTYFLKQRLESIKQYYDSIPLFDAISELNYKEELELFNELIESPKDFQLKQFHDLWPNYDHAVFEGSQGILLDMAHGIFPNVTYANTTSKNAQYYVYDFVETYYVTRCYQTRHGNGYMSNEDKPITLINTEEEINVTNQWQGNFRTGELDYDLLDYAIKVDQIHNKCSEKNHLVVTCCDQRPDFTFDLSKCPAIINNVYYNNSPHAGNMHL